MRTPATFAATPEKRTTAALAIEHLAQFRGGISFCVDLDPRWVIKLIKRGKIEEAGMPKETKEKALQELKRLEAMPGVSAEATVSRNYIVIAILEGEDAGDADHGGLQRRRQRRAPSHSRGRPPARAASRNGSRISS